MFRPEWSHLACGVPFGLPPEQHVDRRKEGYDRDKPRDLSERGEVHVPFPFDRPPFVSTTHPACSFHCQGDVRKGLMSSCSTKQSFFVWKF